MSGKDQRVEQEATRMYYEILTRRESKISGTETLVRAVVIRVRQMLAGDLYADLDAGE